MTKQTLNNQQQVQPQEQQGEGVELKYLLESYMQKTNELTKENLMLKAYISQMKSKEAAAQSQQPDGESGQPAK